MSFEEKLNRKLYAYRHNLNMKCDIFLIYLYLLHISKKT